MLSSFTHLQVFALVADPLLRDAIAQSRLPQLVDYRQCATRDELVDGLRDATAQVAPEPPPVIVCDLAATKQFGLLAPGEPAAALPIVFLLSQADESALQAAMSRDAEILPVDAQGIWLELLPAWIERSSARFGSPRATSDAPADWTNEKLRLLAAALETATDGILITDPKLPDNPIIYASPSFTQLTGYSPVETLGRNCRFLQGAETDRAVVAHIRGSLERGEGFHGVLLNYRRDGTPFWNELRIRPFRDAAGQITWFVGSLSDITERRKAEEGVHTYQQRFATAFRCSPNPVSISRVTDGLVYEVNEQWKSDFGFSREEMVGRTSQELNLFLDPQDRERAKQVFNREGRLRNFEMALRTASKEIRHVLVSSEPIDVDGIACILTTIVDVTDRRRAEDNARQHLAALAHVNRLVTAGELASGLAHELNQPLSAIRVHAELALAALPGESGEPAAVRQSLSTVVAQVQRASNIIQMLRSLVRKDQPRRTTVVLNDLVRDTIFLVEPALRDAGVDLKLDLSGERILILCDPIQVSQVLLNLLQNALEALESIPRERRAIAICTSLGQKRAMIQVADSGVGFPAGETERLFDTFYTTKRGGLGLGLKISRSLVEAHGGRLMARENPGGGAILEITLPLPNGA